MKITAAVERVGGKWRFVSEDSVHELREYFAGVYLARGYSNMPRHEWITRSITNILKDGLRPGVDVLVLQNEEDAIILHTTAISKGQALSAAA